MKQKLEQYSYAAKKRKTGRIVNLIITVILIFTIINVILNHLIYPVRQASVSMQPDIAENSFVMVTPLKLKVKRGDVVLLKPREEKETSFFKKAADVFVKFFTLQQITLQNDNDFPGTQNELRRVIGMPGDTIYIRDYVMYIKPKGEKLFLTEFEITDKKYNVTFSIAPAGWDSKVGVNGYSEEIVLGEDEYFLLGDNRKSCSDSRLWGTVSSDSIKGKALVCYFPFNKFKLL